MKTKISLLSISLGMAFTPLLSAELITENEVEDSNPIISGELILWQSRVAPDPVEPSIPEEPSVPEEPGEPGEPVEPTPNDFEIMIKVGGEIRQLTDNGFDDINPSISGHDIVWQSWDGTDWEIWAYNTTCDCFQQLTDNETDDINPQIDNNRVVWQAWDGTDYEIATDTVDLEPSFVEFKLSPGSLNLRSNGKWMQASIKFEDTGIDPASVDVSTIFLEGDISPEKVKVKSSSITMKFSRSALQEKLAGHAAGDAEVSIVAETLDGSELLMGTVVIKVIP